MHNKEIPFWNKRTIRKLFLYIVTTSSKTMSLRFLSAKLKYR